MRYEKHLPISQAAQGICMHAAGIVQLKHRQHSRLSSPNDRGTLPLAILGSRMNQLTYQKSSRIQALSTANVDKVSGVFSQTFLYKIL